MLWIEHTGMLVRCKQLSGEIGRVTHSSFPRSSFTYSSPAPLIVTSKKVKIFLSFSFSHIHSECTHGNWFFLFYFFSQMLWPGGVQCICGTVRNWASSGQVNYMCGEIITIPETFHRLYCGKLFSKLKSVCKRVHHFCKPINHVLIDHRGYFPFTLFDSERQQLQHYFTVIVLI